MDITWATGSSRSVWHDHVKSAAGLQVEAVDTNDVRCNAAATNDIDLCVRKSMVLLNFKVEEEFFIIKMFCPQSNCGQTHERFDCAQRDKL